MRLQMARRQVDEEPADAASAYRGKLSGDQLDMPVHREEGARIELAKGAQRKARQVVPEQCGALLRRGILTDERGRCGQRDGSPAAEAASAASTAI